MSFSRRIAITALAFAALATSSAAFADTNDEQFNGVTVTAAAQDFDGDVAVEVGQYTTDTTCRTGGVATVRVSDMTQSVPVDAGSCIVVLPELAIP